MSPIFTRPYREQHEHDRIIRHLQARYRRKHEVVVNLGSEQHGAVTVGELPVYPDLLLYSQEPTRHLEALVEVETGESVHLLEARAEWGVFSQVPVPFILYVPLPMLETARRIIDEQQWRVSEIWTYLPGMDQLRFVQMFTHPNPPVVVPPTMPTRVTDTAAASAEPAPSPKTPAAATTPARAPAARSSGGGPPGGPTQEKSAAKKPPTRAAKPSPKAAARTGAARPAPPAKAAARGTVKTVSPRASASGTASSARKSVASKKAAPSGGKPPRQTRPATADRKKAATGTNKPAASVKSGPTRTGAARATVSKKPSAVGKPAGRR